MVNNSAEGQGSQRAVVPMMMIMMKCIDGTKEAEIFVYLPIVFFLPQVS
jgi:hypothetical protein